MKELNYFVAYDIPAETQDDKKTKREIIAGFRYHFQAEEFIKTLPEESRCIFYIIINN